MRVAPVRPDGAIKLLSTSVSIPTAIALKTTSPRTMDACMTSVINDTRKPPRARQENRRQTRRASTGVATGKRTGVYRRHGALHNDNGEAIQPGQGVDDLLHRREFGHHVQKHRDEPGARRSDNRVERIGPDLRGLSRHSAQINGSNDAVSLPRPLGQDKALR